MCKLCVSCLVVCFLGSTCGQTDIRKPPTITKHPSAAVIYRSDDSVTLECKAEGKPDVTYEWKKNGAELNPNQPNIQKVVDGTITIHPATSMDEGFYQCFARNQYGTALSITAHIQRAVLDSASGTPTTLQKTVQEGMPFQIQADPRRSFPKPTYGWEFASDTVDKNPVPLRTSRRIQIAANGDLHFAYAQPDDAPEGKLYKCTTYNPYQDVKAGGSYTKVTMTRSNFSQFAPTLGFASDAQTVAVIGGSLTIRCFFYGNPEPTVSWSGPRNTLPIGRLARNNFDTELVINNITATDEGDYICSASTTQGSNTHTLQIRVEAVPRFLTVQDGPRDVNVTEGDSYTFNCKADAKPEATIVWLQDGKELDPDNPPKRFVFSNDKKSLTIRDVCRNCDDRENKHTDLTVIQCIASNSHGYAFGSGYLNVLSKTVVTIHDAADVTVDAAEEDRVQFDCRATTDPSTPPSFKWFKVETKGDRLLYDERPFLTVDAGLLSIHVDAANATQKWPTYLGQYRCVVDTRHSRANQTANIYPAIVTVPLVTANVCGVLFGLQICWFWVSIGAAVFGLFVIFVFICCAICQRKKGEKYNIDKKEKWTGRDPVKEFLDDGFQEYQRQECITPTLLSSRPSFSSATLLRITEEDSLNEYMGDVGKFTEDGSFIGDTYRSQSRLQ